MESPEQKDITLLCGTLWVSADGMMHPVQTPKSDSFNRALPLEFVAQASVPAVLGPVQFVTLWFLIPIHIFTEFHDTCFESDQGF